MHIELFFNIVLQYYFKLIFHVVDGARVDKAIELLRRLSEDWALNTERGEALARSGPSSLREVRP